MPTCCASGGVSRALPAAIPRRQSEVTLAKLWLNSQRRVYHVTPVPSRNGPSGGSALNYPCDVPGSSHWTCARRKSRAGVVRQRSGRNHGATTRSAGRYRCCTSKPARPVCRRPGTFWGNNRGNKRNTWTASLSTAPVFPVPERENIGHPAGSSIPTRVETVRLSCSMCNIPLQPERIKCQKPI